VLKRFFLISLFLLLPFGIFAETLKFADAGGSGAYPYNFRIINSELFAGGSLFNPVTKANSDQKVSEYLDLLKSFGVKHIVLLHVPKDDPLNARLKKLALLKDIKVTEMKMHAKKVPTALETEQILSMINEKAYVQCMWGCDRTGAVIGKYLRSKGKSGREAFDAIVTKGESAGPLGGFKVTAFNKNLLLYFWPEVAEEAPEILEKF